MQRLTKLKLLYEEVFYFIQKIQKVFFPESPEYIALTDVLEQITSTCSQVKFLSDRRMNLRKNMKIQF